MRSLVAPADAATYTSTPATQDGELVLLLRDDVDRQALRRLEGRPGAPAAASATIAERRDRGGGRLRGRQGRRALRNRPAAGLARHPHRGARFIRPEGLSIANEVQPTLVYDEASDTFTNVETGVVFSDNGEGSYASPAGEELEPGWRTHIGFANFTTILTDPLVRDPFFRVFVWTFAYAFLSVLIQFAIGLFLAITLNKPDLQLRRIQRALLVIPFAVPAFLSCSSGGAC